MKHCIITPELAGPSPHGGIGTHCFYLARFLGKKLGRNATVLLTSPVENRDTAYWREFFREECGCGFEELSGQPPFTKIPHEGNPHQLVSLAARRYLEAHPFDFCHFQDYFGNGFAPAQARRAGLALRGTPFTCMMHSSSEWLRECMRHFPVQGARGIGLDFLERYAVEHADYALAPVRYMFRWAEARGWPLPPRRRVLPYLVDGLTPPPQAPPDPDHIIFFGRLETRKGVDVFLKALYRLSSQYQFYKHNLKVTFLGRSNNVNGMDGLEFVRGWEKGIPANHTWEYRPELNHFQALEYLRQHSGALVVIPSLVDNSPFTVIESLELGLNVIAADAGGIPELMGTPERLFKPDPESLAAKIAHIRRDGLPPLAGPHYRRETAEKQWERFIAEIESEALRAGEPPVAPVSGSRSKVSVIVPHRNLGEHLPAALDSLARQTCGNYEVIVLDDGSDDPASLDVFARMENTYQDRGWTFARKENTGLGHTRNLGAAQASGEFLIFMDADNMAEPRMAETMAHALEVSGADCLTCYYRAFLEKLENDDDFKCCFLPAGPCLELAFFDNCLGDANFIVRGETFKELGGFIEDEATATHDWRFLLALIQKGRRVDVIPEFLLQYRIRARSMVQTRDRYYSHLSSIQPLLDEIPLWARRVVLTALGLENENKRLSKECIRLRSARGKPRKYPLAAALARLRRMLSAKKNRTEFFSR